jgi:hypothetical protein
MAVELLNMCTHAQVPLNFYERILRLFKNYATLHMDDDHNTTWKSIPTTRDKLLAQLKAQIPCVQPHSYLVTSTNDIVPKFEFKAQLLDLFSSSYFFWILLFKRRYSATKPKAVPFLHRILREQRQPLSMPTPSLAPVVEGTEDTMDINPSPRYNYDVKIEFMLKSPGETVYAKAIMVKTMKAIQSTIRKGKFVTFHDVCEADPVHLELRGIVPEERADKFCFEVGGPGRLIPFFGFLLKSNISFQVLKKRTFDEFKMTSTFMRLHLGGFGHGVNSSTMGFILKEHPIFTDVNTMWRLNGQTIPTSLPPTRKPTLLIQSKRLSHHSTFL